jgi:hypothetical protein
MPLTSVLISLPAGNYLTHNPWQQSEPESKLFYDVWITANRFILASSPLRFTNRNISFLQLNPCSHSPYVTSSLMRGWVCLLWISFAFVKCPYCTYSMQLKIHPCALYTCPLSVQAFMVSELLYDWQFTANQFILASSPLRIMTRDFFSTQPLLS